MDASAVSNAAGEISRSQASRTKLAESMDTFLKLLTTQLKHQDPLSPMESNEFTNQLVQFASVEQQINSNQTLEKLLSMQQVNQVSSALSYIGNGVQVLSAGLPLQDGAAGFAYTTPKDTAKVQLIISDPTGKVVYTKAGEAKAGTHTGTWDGKDGLGNQLPDGDYFIKVTAENAHKEVIDLDTATTGRVTSVSAAGGAVTLFMGGIAVGTQDVIKIMAPAAPAETETTNG